MIAHLFAAAILVVGARFLPHGGFAELSAAQRYAFPIVAAFLVFHPWFSKKVPRNIVLLAAFVGVLSYGPFWRGAERGVAVATLKGDQFSSKSRIVRDMIQDSPKYKKEEGVGLLYASILNEKDARERLGEGKNSILIWGDEERIRVSVANEGAHIVSDPIGAPYESLRGFGLVQTIPNFYMSFSPQQNTVDFIGGFLSGFVPTLSEYLKLSPEEAELSDLHLKDISEMLSRWTNFTHRSVAYFHLGTRIIASELKENEYHPDRLNAALRSYQTAASFLMWRDDPELKAALFNNSGIVYLMKFGAEGKREFRKQGRKYLKTAKRFTGAKSPFGVKALKSPRVAKRNLSILKEIIQSERGVNEKRRGDKEADPSRPKKKRHSRAG